ncbi:YtzI protein [Priestia koreensis]|uniref:YtzI protein n=1 Tax=Priestia koreensis TaxID=284581 RepID=UPI0009F8C9DA|nr:YtzI protein [Priestia koreensis]MCM3002891.1 YtzI protein [Priestia koreensis]UNL84575.1 YtzI protein [Priestia koreensis]
MFTIIFITCFVIVAIVLLLSLVTTSKAYDFKHTVDPLDENPHLDSTDKKDT